MTSNVAKMYADLIKMGIKTLDDVPEAIKKEVKELLNEQTQANANA